MSVVKILLPQSCMSCTSSVLITDQNPLIRLYKFNYNWSNVEKTVQPWHRMFFPIESHRLSIPKSLNRSARILSVMYVKIIAVISVCQSLSINFIHQIYYLFKTGCTTNFIYVSLLILYLVKKKQCKTFEETSVEYSSF